MYHKFSVEIATKYGLEEAIFLDNIYFWIQKNMANEEHYHDGRYWTYNTQKAFTKLFPYMSQSKISRMTKKLEEEGILMTGNYNKVKYDRTKWYSLTDKGLSLFNSKGSNMQSEYSNIQSDLTIPDKTTDKNTYNNIYSSSEDEPLTPTSKSDKKKKAKQQVEDNFEKMWKLYPKKRGKGRVSYTKKEEIYKLGDEFKRCIERYLKDVEKRRRTGFEQLQYKNGSTFFNSGYVDYLDENYEDVVKEEEDKPQNYKPFDDREVKELQQMVERRR